MSGMMDRLKAVASRIGAALVPDAGEAPARSSRALRDDMLGRLAVGPVFARRHGALVRAMEGYCGSCGHQRACRAKLAANVGVPAPCWNVGAFEGAMAGR